MELKVNLNAKITTSVDIAIDRNKAYQRMGYKGRSPSASTLSLIDSQIEKAHKLIKPAYTYELKAIEHVIGEEFSFGDSMVFTSRTVSYALSDCKCGAVYVATIGSDLGEEMSRLLKEGEVLEATILDAIGSEAVAQTSHKLQDAVKEIAKASGCLATIKYSPGYCDWHVSQQRILFQTIDSASVGVRLTESCMMIPLKSVSGIIGIGKFDSAKPPPCLAVCNKRASCTHKRIGWDPEKQWVW